ncbi:MAG: helix-turn-helix transcriptional regulator [Elusimicrobia bacterium]|nr:helix-turn-helix transcriptional regulator [Elusimicrobiota bacterium]
MTEQTQTLRFNIGAQIRKLRQKRRWSQTRLATLLGISQNYLSLLERGRGSFTAEQLLTILRHFNVPIDYFSPNKPPSRVEDQIQNALAREGASHLVESSELLPSESLKGASNTIREALVSAESSRQITAIAPIIATHAGRLNLNRLHNEFITLGLENRLRWAIDNTLEALKLESSQALPREWRLKYRRASTIIEAYFAPWRILARPTINPEQPQASDVLDPDITSTESLDQVRTELSPISKRWGIVTRIEADDFAQALKAARGTD